MTLGKVLDLDSKYTKAISTLAGEISAEYDSSECPRLQHDLPLLAHRMPEPVKQEVNRFRLGDDSGYLLIRGHPIDDDALGPTPKDWRVRSEPNPAFHEEIVLLLYGALLGEPFGWTTQQDGRLVHEVFPMERDAMAQLGTGSLTALTWHTEDAFHPFRADYLLLLGLRNPDGVPTTVGSLEIDSVPPETVDLLFSDRFIIDPDNSHLAANNGAGQAEQAMFDRIEDMRNRSEPVPVLCGNPRSPYVRIDPYFMRTPPGDARAEQALAAAVEAIEDNLVDIVLEPGDVLILDNFRVVHGRRAFNPRYDGRDRWLKRINVTRDLRKSARLRRLSSRLIG